MQPGSRVRTHIGNLPYHCDENTPQQQTVRGKVGLGSQFQPLTGGEGMVVETGQSLAGKSVRWENK